MPFLAFRAPPVLAARYSTAHEFYDVLAKESDPRTLRRIVNEHAVFFVGNRAFRLVVKGIAPADAGQRADIWLERTWHEYNWFHRLVLHLLKPLASPSARYGERPRPNQCAGVWRTIIQLRCPPRPAPAEVPAEVPAPADEAASAAAASAAAVDPAPGLEPRAALPPAALPPDVRQMRLRAMAERIRAAETCHLFAGKEHWRQVVCEIADNDPPECLDVVASAVLAQLTVTTTQLLGAGPEHESSLQQVVYVLGQVANAAAAGNAKRPELAKDLTDAWKKHWWHGTIGQALRDFRLPVGVVERVGRHLNANWQLIVDQLGTMTLRDRHITKLKAASAKVDSDRGWPTTTVLA